MGLQRFTAEEQQQNERLARLQYGRDTVNESLARWNSYTKAQQEAILEEGDAIYAAFADATQAGTDPTDPTVTDLLERWHDHLRNFYEPTLDVLRGLGETYALDERFRENFARIHPNLADYLREAITEYVD